MQIISQKIWTVNMVYGEFPEAVSRWEALGQADTNIHWAYGQEADALITHGVPAMLVYAAIGRKAGVKSQTIRKAYYTWKTFTDAQREQYHLVPYSVFRHARTCDNPEAVLEYYVNEGGVSVDEIEIVFPANEEAEEFEKADYPRYLVGAWRRLVGLPATIRTQAEFHLREFARLVEVETA